MSNIPKEQVGVKGQGILRDNAGTEREREMKSKRGKQEKGERERETAISTKWRTIDIGVEMVHLTRGQREPRRAFLLLTAIVLQNAS